MKIKIHLFYAIIMSLFVFILACSTGKQDYQDLIKIQQATEQNLQQTANYDIRIQSCDYIIKDLSKFLNKYPNGEWSDVARIALQSWQSRKIAFMSERNSLINELSETLLKEAEETAQKQHPLSNIEKIILESNNINAVENRIFITSIYNFRMKGAIIGRDIFKLKVTVSGYIATDSKKVSINNNPQVDE